MALFQAFLHVAHLLSRTPSGVPALGQGTGPGKALPGSQDCRGWGVKQVREVLGMPLFRVQLWGGSVFFKESRAQREL